MQLIARTRLAAHIDGREIRLDAGAAFRGSEREAKRLIGMGLLEEKPKPKGKGEDNER